MTLSSNYLCLSNYRNGIETIVTNLKLEINIRQVKRCRKKDEGERGRENARDQERERKRDEDEERETGGG